MCDNLLSAATEIRDDLVRWRRHLHAHPELSGREERTAAFVADQLRAMGYEPHEGLGGTRGLSTTLRIGSDDAVALRADMDALPITEETGVDYASTVPGVMHACGHDAHMAMLLGAARLLADRRAALPQSVRLIFQPHEELSPGGAPTLIGAGVLDGVTRIFGLHIWSQLPVGTIATRAGAFMSSTDDLDILVEGRGGHAAMPHECIDPVIVAAEMVLALQTIVSRGIAMTDSAVVSITQVAAGNACNVIPAQVRMRGTVRTLDSAVRRRVTTRVREVVERVAASHEAGATVKISTGYPTLVNDQQAVADALHAVRAAEIGVELDDQLPAQGGGEDFAYYAERLPAAFLFLGAGNADKLCHYPHHHPRFNVDEDALPIGAATLAALALHQHQAAAD